MTVTIEGNTSPIERLLTGLWSFDRAFENRKGEIGFTLNVGTEVYGPNHCLDKNTFIPYHIVDKNGKIQNKKGGTIERLYERFHRFGGKKGKGYYQRPQTIDSDFYVQSIDEHNRIIRNKVVNVLYKGIAPCYEITTKKDRKIICTLDHKFYTSYGRYLSLSELAIGDEIYIHDNTIKTRHPKYIHYNEVTVKYHPRFNIKKVNGYTYHRGRFCNLVYEAYRNEVSVKDYIDALDTRPPEEIDNFWWHIPEGYVIHHIDFDPKNDKLENLRLMTDVEHKILHGKFLPPRYIVTPDQLISIEPIGERDVYDITCQSPHHNYIANGIVVHNCGKSTITYSLAGIIAKELGQNIALADFEGFDPDFLKTVLESSGFDGKLKYIQEPDDETTLDNLIHDLRDKKNPYCVGIVDSVGAISPLAEQSGDLGEANMGRRAFLLAQFSRKAIKLLRETETPKNIFMINHAYPQIGGRGKTTPGGEVKNYLNSVRISIKRRYYKGKYEEFPDGSYIIEGEVIKNRWGYKDRKFYLFVLSGSGIHQGLTAMYDAIVLGLVDKARTIKIGDTNFGGLKKIIDQAQNGNDEFFDPFFEVLKNYKGEDVEIESEDEDKPEDIVDE